MGKVHTRRHISKWLIKWSTPSPPGTGAELLISNFWICSAFILHWVPDDFFFLSILMVRGEAALTRRKEPRKKKSRKPYQTVSTVYFISGILTTDLCSQGTFISSSNLSIISFFLYFLVIRGSLRYKLTEQS